MIPAPTIIIPDEAGRADWLDPYYEHWKEEKEATEPKFVIENVRFEHDPNWQMRTISISKARTGTGPVWGTVRILFAIGAGSLGAFSYTTGSDIFELIAFAIGASMMWHRTRTRHAPANP
jgi:hypothetical protein